MHRKAVIRFAVVALVLYGVFTLAWDGFGKFYAGCFRATLRATLISDSGLREIDIPSEQPKAEVSQVVIANRNLLAADGSGPVRNVNLPNATFWQATALLFALSLATPRRWPQRILATLVGFLIVQAFIAATVSFAVWNESRHVGLAAIDPGWETNADRLQAILSEQACLLVPVIAWLAGLWTILRKR